MTDRKTCTRCGDDFTIDSFPARRVNGESYKGSWCSLCHAEYAKEWRARNPWSESNIHSSKRRKARTRT